jgi:hypothetical protein
MSSAATDDEREERARSVGRLLSRISAKDAEAAWGTWIPGYWMRRREGPPLRFAHGRARIYGGNRGRATRSSSRRRTA